MLSARAVAIRLAPVLFWTRAAATATDADRVAGQRLAHQPRTKDNGRMPPVFESSTPGRIPPYESRDDGDHWRQVGEIVDQPHDDPQRWQLRWRPRLSELARPGGDLPAGTRHLRYADIGVVAVLQVQVNNRARADRDAPAVAAGWRFAEFDAPLRAGADRIVLSDDRRPLDYDYLQLTSVTP